MVTHYSFYMATVLNIVSRCGHRNDAHHRTNLIKVTELEIAVGHFVANFHHL